MAAEGIGISATAMMKHCAPNYLRKKAERKKGTACRLTYLYKEIYMIRLPKNTFLANYTHKRRIRMALVDKEKIRMFAMRRSMGMMQNPKVMKAIVKALEHRNKTKAKIDDTANKVAKTFNLVVKNEITETNHSIRALEDNVRELSETVEDLQKQINKSAPKKKKADQPSN